MKGEPEVSPPKREPKCSFCGEETHSYNTCPVLRQMIFKQAVELTRQPAAEYKKSQKEALKHTIREEYGPTILVSNPMTARFNMPALHHPSEEGAGWVGLKGEDQTHKGSGWRGQVGGLWDD